MDEERPAKRARQACEPCRRKKSRCPGERPSCSYCERLSQVCEYRDNHDAVNNTAARSMQDRITNLEGKLDQVLEQLLPAVTPPQQHPSPTQTPPWDRTASEASNARPNRRPSFRTSVRGDDMAPRSEAQEAARLYLTWLHCQPVKLFDTSSFVRTIESRDAQVVLSIRALCLRFPPGTLTASKQESIRAMTRQSRRLVMDRVGDGQVNLATVQALCLLSMNDLADGQTIQAGAKLALANNLANSVPADATLGEAQEFLDCKQTITLLLNLYGSVLPGSYLEDTAMTKWRTSPAPQLSRDTGLIACMVHLSEAWRMARVYAATRVARDAPPPWHPLSDYSIITQRILDIECNMPMKHRFAGSHFIEETQEELQEKRHYWGPWLFLQFVYGGVLCLLNHPYLLSLRLRSFHQTLPQTFIHQSFKLISRQSSWITYFVDILERREFLIPDPTLAHCVAVVATIHLQHSFVPNPVLRERSQAGFRSSIRFLRSMGTIWPCVLNMADNLDNLQRSVVEIPTSTTDSSGRAVPTRSIDANLLRNILIYERAGQPGAAPDRSVFGDNLTPVSIAVNSDDEAVTIDYGLVGSAGIEGHSSNKAKTTPLYPPEHVSPAPMTGGAAMALGSANLGNIAEDSTGTQDWGVSDRYRGKSILESDIGEMSFQADDFGRAIDGWMNLQLC